MIASTLVAAALATTPAQAAPAAAPVHDHSAMAATQSERADHATAGHSAMAKGKMDCCKDGCECCAKMGEKKPDAKPAS